MLDRNGDPLDDTSPYTRAFAAQLENGAVEAPYTLLLAARVELGNVDIDALEHAALERLAATRTTDMRELFEATARCMGLPEPVQDFGVDNSEDSDVEQPPNPYFAHSGKFF